MGLLTVQIHQIANVISNLSGFFALGSKNEEAAIVDLGTVLDNTYEKLSRKNAANGYAGLDANSKINPSHLPAIAVTDTFVVNTQTAMLALDAQTGDVAVRTDINKSFILQGADPSILGSWQELLTPTDAVASVFGRTGIVTAQSGDYNADQVTETASRVFLTPAEKSSINNRMRIEVSGSADLNTAIIAGSYRWGGTVINGATGIAGYGQLLVIRGGGDSITQLYTNYGDRRTWIRAGNPTEIGGSGTFGAWRELAFLDGAAFTGNVTTTSYISATGGVRISAITKNGTDVPSEYPEGISYMSIGASNSGWPVTYMGVTTYKFDSSRVYQHGYNVLSPYQNWYRIKTNGSDTWEPWQIIGNVIEKATITGTANLEVAHIGKIIEFNSTSNFTFTLTQKYDGFQCTLVNINTGDVTLAAGSGVTIRHETANRKITTQWRFVSLYYRSATEVVISGTLEA